MKNLRGQIIPDGADLLPLENANCPKAPDGSKMVDYNLTRLVVIFRQLDATLKDPLSFERQYYSMPNNWTLFEELERWRRKLHFFYERINTPFANTDLHYYGTLLAAQFDKLYEHVTVDMLPPGPNAVGVRVFKRRAQPAAAVESGGAYDGAY